MGVGRNRDTVFCPGHNHHDEVLHVASFIKVLETRTVASLEKYSKHVLLPHWKSTPNYVLCPCHSGGISMRLTMAERKSLTHVFVDRYRYASKLEKICILNEFIDYTGFNRNYASRVLRKTINNNGISPHAKNHAAKYDLNVKIVLEKLWGITDYLCGKRLVAIIPELIQKSEQFHEFEIPDDTKEKLKKISAATIDRLLTPDRKNLNDKRHSVSH
jgi:hypothetical protein